MVWFRETGKGEAFSWLDHSSSTEWWTFDLLVCQKLHQQTNRRDLSPAGDSLYQQWLGAEAGSGWFPLWQSGFLHAVAVEGTNRSFWWSFCWEHFLWGTAGPGEAELPSESCLVWMQTPSLRLQISLCWHLCSCLLSCSFSGIYKVIREASGKVPGL